MGEPVFGHSEPHVPDVLEMLADASNTLYQAAARCDDPEMKFEIECLADSAEDLIPKGDGK